MKALTAILIGLCLIPAAPVLAAEHHHAVSGHAAMGKEHAALSEGVIRKVNRASGKVTIRHGELANLGMPPMTMTFRVRDKALLHAVKPGDKVRFRAESSGGSLVVTELSVVR